jgi:hypothetical protein
VAVAMPVAPSAPAVAVMITVTDVAVVMVDVATSA